MQAQPLIESPTLNVQPFRRDLFLAWFGFWVRVWGGTTGAGGSFGFLFGFFVTAFDNPSEMGSSAMMGFFFGLAYAALVGALILPTLVAVLWVCNLKRRPKLLACVAGGLIGTICLPPAFFVTGTMGSLGAYWTIKHFLKSTDGELILYAEQERLAEPRSVFNYSLSSLFLRTTVIALVVAFWTGVYRLIVSGFNY